MRRSIRVCAVAIAAAAMIGFGTTTPAVGAEPVPGQDAAHVATERPSPEEQPGPEVPSSEEPGTETSNSEEPAPPTSEEPEQPGSELPAPPVSDEPESDPDPKPDASAEPTPPTTAPSNPGDVASMTRAAAQTVITGFGPGVHRLAGLDRFETAVAISKRFAPNVPVVYIATGADFPDALTAAAAAAHRGGPLLLTHSDALPAAVRAEIVRLAPARIVVAGGEGVVDISVYDELAALTPSISRLGGSDRFETAERLIADAFGSATTAFIATSRDFPDALAASAASRSLGAPVFLVDGLSRSVRASTVGAMRVLGVRTVRIAGASGAVSVDIERQLASGFSVIRHEGHDRYLTAAAINESVFRGSGAPAVTSVFFATGSDFADALAGAALAGGLRSPLYITRSECIPHPVAVAINELDPSARVIIGGPGAVGDAVARNSACAIVWAKPAAGRITDGFGPRDPICTPGGCTQSFHRGVDLATGCRAPIYAASGGRVSTAGWVGTYGNFVKIAHGSGIDTGYAHLVNGGTLVSVGQLVRAGEQIGWSGATGAATGCHLHFEVYQGGTRIDPVPFLSLRGVRLG